MRLVTVATHSAGYFDFLQQSCTRNNIKLDVLGFGEKWQGFGWRMNMVQDYINSIQDDNEVICFIDAYDVIVLRPLDEMEALFRLFSKTTGTDIIIGHEKHVSIFIHILGKIIFGDCDGVAINAGTYIGFKGAIKKMLDTAKSYDSSLDSDDQVLITKYATNNINSIYIDTGSIFFLTIANQLSNFDIDTVVINNGELFYKGTAPFFAHGCGNTCMNSLVERLGYKMTEVQKQSLTDWNYTNSWKKVCYYTKMYTVHVTIAICIVILLAVFLNRKK